MWVLRDLPRLRAVGRTGVVSFGRRTDEALAQRPPEGFRIREDVALDHDLQPRIPSVAARSYLLNKHCSRCQSRRRSKSAAMNDCATLHFNTNKED